MKAKLLTQENIKKAEFWIATIAYGIFLLAILTANSGDVANIPYDFRAHHIQYNHFANYFAPMFVIGTLVYAAILTFILKIEPFWEEKKDVLKTGLMVLGIFIVLSLALSICNTYINAWKFGVYKNENTTYRHVFFESFANMGIAFIFYAAYNLVKQIGIIVFNRFPKNTLQTLSPNALKYLFAFLAWFFILIFSINNVPKGVVALWLVIIPYSVFIVQLHLKYLLPTAPVKKFMHNAYIWRALIFICFSNLLATVFFSGVTSINGGSMVACFFLILLWTFVILVPISWYLYNLESKNTLLVSALGKSDASLSFLKAQINPHFLFNALNTLYGTALQENAERTSEGIQKLGDMMRFMLHENTQDSISLARDIDYLNNYIALQKLRTSRSADILIETQIEEVFAPLEIAPMLLIPFVENAFKHGISLQNPSHIKITLQTKANRIYFDVSNSINLKMENDPERFKSGIGLQNVKKRLALFYPEKHELIIRESAKEFFIHLTIELK